MNMTCHKCGYTDQYLEFAYLCKNGCPACGESDLRRCPKCGAECVFSRAEALEDEDVKMQELSERLAAINSASGPDGLNEAKQIILQLRSMNLRWNMPELDMFLKKRQKELFF